MIVGAFAVQITVVVVVGSRRRHERAHNDGGGGGEQGDETLHYCSCASVSMQLGHFRDYFAALLFISGV